MPKSIARVSTNKEQGPDRSISNGWAPSAAWDYRVAFDRSPDPITVTNAAGLHIDANPAALAFLGYERDELLRLSTRDLVSPGPTWTPEGTEQFIQSGGWEGEVEIRTKRGPLATYARVVVLPAAEGGLHVTFLQDLGERKRGEETRARLAALVASSSDAIVGWSTDGMITDWNPAAERLYGYAAAEVIGQPVALLVPPDLRPEFEDLYAHARQGHGSEGFETVRLAKDGRRIDVSLTISPVWNDARQIIGGSTITRDITGQKAAAAALAASEQRFRVAFQDAPIGMIVSDVDANPIQVNHALCALLGYTEAELLATTPRDRGHPDDLAATLAWIKQALAGEIDCFEQEKRYLTRDGQTIRGLLTASLVRDDAGTPLQFIAQIQDITARKETEEELAASHSRARQVLERITDGFFALGLDWRFTYINAVAERFLGRSRDDLLGANIWNAYPSAIETPVYHAYQRAMEAGVTENVEFYYPPLDAWFAARAYPSPEGLAVFFRDVTASREVAQELRESEEKYRSLVQHLSAAVYVLAADQNQRPLFVSPYHEVLTGYSLEEVLARERNWLDFVHPDDYDRVAAEDARCLITGEPLRIEYRYARKDGSYVWVLDDSVALRDENGTIVAFQGVLMDVNDRVLAEEAQARLATIVESAQDAILSCSLDGIITSWNHGAEDLFGYSAAEAIGASVTILPPPELADDSARMMDQVRRGESVKGHETIRLTREGARIDVSMSLSPVRDAGGRIVAISTVARDITALRRTEQRLRLRDRALAAATNGIIITDSTQPGDPIVDINPAFAAMTGYRREDVIGRNLGFLVGPETDPAAVERIAAAVAAGNDLSETLLTYRKDGTSFWSDLHVAAVRDEGGALTHIVGIQSDVTPRVEAQEALARERDLLKAVMDQLPDAVYVKDTASRFLRLNQATARQLGIADPAMAIGKTDHDFYPALQADEYRQNDLHLMETGAPMISKLERPTVGDRELWVLATKAPLRDARGEVVGLVGSNRDVTERLQTADARARLAAIIESAEDAIISRALDGTITTWNHGAERLFGYSPEEAIGRPFTILFPAGEQTAVWDETVGFSGAVMQFETTRQRRDGSLVDVSIAMSPIRDDHGETIGTSTITRDITERKQFEQELRAALEAAEAGVRTKTHFLAMMSHELRTPLQAVLGYTDLLLLGPDDSLSAEQREDLGYIRDGAGRMIALIEQLLDLSRLEAGRLVLQTTSVDPREIIEVVRQDVAPQAAAKGLALCIELPASLPRVRGDPDRLRQILLNLAGNAVKFTQHGEVCISARENTDGVALEVRDTGIGISAEALPLVFEEFRQVDGNLTRRYGGAGLGLAIASKLAEQMGGSISVDSTPGSGSTFTLLMPLVKPSRGKRRGSAKSHASATGNGRAQPGRGPMASIATGEDQPALTDDGGRGMTSPPPRAGS